VKGTGTDIVSIARLAKSLARSTSFAEEVFGEGERRYCEAQRHPAQHYAARFAAKEAFLKAVGLGIFGGVALRDIEVTKDVSGPPRLELGPTAEEALDRVGATRSMVSLSHEGDYAIAVVIVS
jgi:holo-[acyl-carrier protein] synthase